MSVSPSYLIDIHSNRGGVHGTTSHAFLSLALALLSIAQSARKSNQENGKVQENNRLEH